MFQQLLFFAIIHFSSIAQSPPTLCDPMDYSMPGPPVHNQFPGSTQTHVHWVSHAIQLSHPLSSLYRLMSIESKMPSSHLNLCCPLFLPSIFPNIRVFSDESALRIGGQITGVLASTSVLSMNIQDWSPLGWTGWIFLQSKGLSRVFSNTTAQKHQFFSAQPSLQFNSHIHTWLLEKP